MVRADVQLARRVKTASGALCACVSTGRAARLAYTASVCLIDACCARSTLPVVGAAVAGALLRLTRARARVTCFPIRAAVAYAACTAVRHIGGADRRVSDTAPTRVAEVIGVAGLEADLSAAQCDARPST